MNLQRSFFLSLVILLGLPWAAGAAPSGADAGAPSLPFRVNSDGSVDQRELLKLTQRPATRDRITDAELEAIKSEHEIDYGRGFRPTEKPELPPRGDLYANSILLSNGVNHTFLPKKALIFVPEPLENRVVEERVGQLILWPDFLKQNLSWLQTREISFETVMGRDPLTPEDLEILQKGNSIVVSVFGGNPVGMLPPKIQPSLTDVGTPVEGMVPDSAPGGSPVENDATTGAAPAGLVAAQANPVEDDLNAAETPSNAVPAKTTSTARSGAFDRLKRGSKSEGR